MLDTGNALQTAATAGRGCCHIDRSRVASGLAQLQLFLLLVRSFPSKFGSTTALQIQRLDELLPTVTRCWTSAVETDGIYSGLPGERDATSVSCCGIMTSHNWLRQFLRSAEVAMFKLGRPLINCLTFPFYSRRFAPVEEYYGWSRTKFQWGPQDVQMFQPDFRVTSGRGPEKIPCTGTQAAKSLPLPLGAMLLCRHSKRA